MSLDASGRRAYVFTGHFERHRGRLGPAPGVEPPRQMGRFPAMHGGRSGGRSPLLYATASAAVPGWGQWGMGRRRVGAALVSASFVVVAAGVVVGLVEGRLVIIGWLFDPDFLLALVIVNFFVAFIRVWATTDAWIGAGGGAARVGLLVLVLLVCIPHAVLGYYGMRTRDAINAVFPAGPQVVATPIETSTTTSTSTTLATTTTGGFSFEREALYRVITAPTTTTTIPTTTTTRLLMGAERVTILLLGGDAGPGRGGLRTDTMMVASVDTRTGDAALFGLPRNMTGFTFSDGSPFPGLGKGLLNEVYPWGRRNPEAFGGIDPGASAVKDVASHLLGIQIDYFILVDMAGFARLIDVLGGVSIPVRKDIAAPIYNREDGSYVMTVIPAGTQTLDGDLALAYARSRTGSNDYSRMARQRCIITAVADQAEPLSLLARLGEILETIEQNVTTDINAQLIPDLVNLAPLVATDRVWVVGFDRGYRIGSVAEGSARPDIDKIRAAVHQALTDPASLDPGLEATTASEACG